MVFPPFRVQIKLPQRPNAGRQARPKAGAQRTLEGVAWTPWLGPATDSLMNLCPFRYPLSASSFCKNSPIFGP
jgi:hypothetical protein